MSCSYADGLSEYDDKGVLGVPEKFDSDDDIYEKSLLLTTWIQEAKHVVVHTGAGISTSAGIPDFRGPNGVWTLEKEGKKPHINISFNDAIPTKTHMALKYLIEKNYVHYIVSQNIDGLHLRTGVSRCHLAELHGNMFIGQCDTCDSQFVRHEATSTVGQKYLGEGCRREVRGRTCRGKLKDTILDWEDGLPERDLDMSNYHSSLADLNICLGTTLQIVPSGNLPLRCQKFGGKVVIINLQPTKHDKKADLIINYYVDEVFEHIMRHLCLEIPEYSEDMDPTKNQIPYACISWSIAKEQLLKYKKLYEDKLKHFRENKRPTVKCKQTKRKVKKEVKHEKVEDKKVKINGDCFEIGTNTKVVTEEKKSIDLTVCESDDEFVE